MTKLRLLLGACAVLSLGVFAATAAGDPNVGPPICSSAGKALGGFHKNLTISGNAYVPRGHTLTVGGNLTVAPGACLDAFTLGTVHVGRNIFVGQGGLLALGCTPNAIGPVAPCHTTTTNDTVGGSIVADRPLTMYLDGDHVAGDIVSRGGGPGLHGEFLNLVFKDNTVGGKLVVLGWEGGWSGAIRNVVGGNLVFSSNGSIQDPDSNEVQTNTVGGDLICRGNSPAAHVNPTDGGQPNTVTGNKVGQCAGL